MYLLLPYAGYKEVYDGGAGSGWLEEFIDALGLPMDVLYETFIRASARENFLDPTYTPPYDASSTQATATQAPTDATIQHTMLDILLYIAGVPWPVASGFTVEQKQAMAAAGWDCLQRKGTRNRILALAAAACDGVIHGWTTPPYGFSIIVPDGAPSPGAMRAIDGGWVPAFGETSTRRPWILRAVRDLVSRTAPAWTQLGVGYSQFRAGFSAAGETVFPSGCRIGTCKDESFEFWSMGLPVWWATAGDTSTISVNSGSANDANPNFEFTGSSALIDMTGEPAGTTTSIYNFGPVNNQMSHRVEVDYSYTNEQQVSVLELIISDHQATDVIFYWDPDTETWSDTEVAIPLPPSAYPATAPRARLRYACNVTPQSALSTVSSPSSYYVMGSSEYRVTIRATSDGTASTQTQYLIYRGQLYELFDLETEDEAGGERTLWLPLRDAPGFVSTSGTAHTTFLLENATSTRSLVKAIPFGPGDLSFDYHPALSGRGYRSWSTWTNLLLRSGMQASTSWTLTNATLTTATTIPTFVIGANAVTHGTWTATSSGASVEQGSLCSVMDLPNRTHIAGIWAKRLSADDATYSYVKLELLSGATVISSAIHSLTAADGWKLLPCPPGTAPGVVGTALSFKVSWYTNAAGSASASTGTISLAYAYVYRTPSDKKGCLYPPIIETDGSTKAVTPRVVTATTAFAAPDLSHPFTQRALATLERGALELTVVPMFDGDQQPNGTIFAFGEDDSNNLLCLDISTQTLRARLIDDTPTPIEATLDLVSHDDPASGECTWKRDTAYTIRVVWNAAASSISLSASNGNSIGTGAALTVDDAVVDSIHIGSNIAGANFFDGWIRDIDIIQLGSPVS